MCWGVFLSFFLSPFFSVSICVCVYVMCICLKIVFFSFFFVLFLGVHKGQCVTIILYIHNKIKIYIKIQKNSLSRGSIIGGRPFRKLRYFLVPRLQTTFVFSQRLEAFQM